MLLGHCDRIRTTHHPHRSTCQVMMISHTHKSLVCLSNISGTWERNRFRFDKRTDVGDFFDLCYIYRQSVGNGDRRPVVSASASIPRRGTCPQVTHVCKIYQSWEHGLMLEFVDYQKCRKVSRGNIKRRDANIRLNWSLTGVGKHNLVLFLIFSFGHSSLFLGVFIRFSF